MSLHKSKMTNVAVQLLLSFDMCVRADLAPIFLSLGSKHESGESSFDGYRGPSSLLTRAFSDVVSRFYWWIHRFTLDKTVFEIGYGDRESIVETTIYYTGIQARFAPWELLLAAEVSDPHVMSGNAWVLTPDFMQRTISSISDGTRRYWHLLASPEPALVDRAQELRGRRLIFAQDEQRKRDRERAVLQASRAFHENRLDEAIKILDPYKDDQDLPRSSTMLLKAAMKRK